METTFFMIKPDGMYHPEIFERLATPSELDGLVIGRIAYITATRELLEKHYAHIADKPFFDDIVEYMTPSPILVGTLTGENAVSKWRNIIGATDPRNAETGTIRAQYGLVIDTMMYNAVHGSDSVENANKEINLWLESDVDVESKSRIKSETNVKSDNTEATTDE